MSAKIDALSRAPHVGGAGSGAPHVGGAGPWRANPRLGRRLFLSMLILWAAIGIGFEIWLAINNAADGNLTDPKARWGYYDWLIDYDAGFVRRGLQGEFFQLISRATGVAPQHIVMVVLATSYAALFVIAAIVFARLKDPSSVLAIAFAPFMFMYGVLEPQGEQSKEVLLMLMVAALSLAHARGSGKANLGPEICLAILPVLTLMHELFFFYSPYILVFAALQPMTRARMIRLALLWLASGVALGIAILFHGTAAEVDPICRSIAQSTHVAELVAVCEADGSVQALGRLPGYYWSVQRDLGGRAMFDSAPTLLMLMALAFGPTLPFLKRMHDVRHPTFLVLVGAVAAALILTAPIFVVAVDWGRFLRIHGVCLGLLLAGMLSRGEKEGWANGVGIPLTGFYGNIYLAAVVFFALSWSVKCTALLIGGGLLLTVAAEAL